MKAGPAAALRLGFGCASLGSEIGYRESCALVEAAYEAGFRHFDVAPPYGNGMAERVLGDVLAPVRQHITLVSKAGIAHPRSAGLLQSVRRLALPLKRHFPGLWQRAAGQARRAAAPCGRFAAEEVQASLEESLRRLRTDYLDALLLHEVQPGDISDGLLETLLRLRTQGRLRAVGIGTGVAASVTLLAQRQDLIEWVQTSHYWGAFVPALHAARRRVTHRSIRAGAVLLSRPEFGLLLQAEGTPVLRSALAEGGTTAMLLLRAAISQAGSESVVLVSTTRSARLRELVHAAAVDPTPELTAALNWVLQRLVLSFPEAEAEAANHQ